MSSANGKTILLVGFHSMHNAGDAALLIMNIRQLASAFENAKFMVTMNYPNENGLLSEYPITPVPSPFHILGTNHKPLSYQIPQFLWGTLVILFFSIMPQFMKNWILKTNWGKLIMAFQESDIVVANSGNLLLSLGRFGWPFILTAFLFSLALFFRKPFYVMPQSIGPLTRKWERMITRWLYSRARLVFVREPISMLLAKEIGIPENKLLLVPDPGFALPATPKEQAYQILKEFDFCKDKINIGVTVISRLTKRMDASAIDQYHEILSQVLLRMASEWDVKLFLFDQVTGPTLNENDGRAAENLRKLLAPVASQVVHVDLKLPPSLLKACYGCMNMMIVSRLHSGIFAMACDIPTLCIGYNPKSEGVLRSLRLEEYLVDINHLSPNFLWQKVSGLWTQRRRVAEHLHSVMSVVENEVYRVGVLIKEDYETIA